MESVLATLPYFARLRADERLRIAAHFHEVHLQPDETLEVDEPRLLVIVDGEARLERGGVTLTLFTGDTVGEVDLATGRSLPSKLTAERASTIATLDAPALAELLAQFPAVAPPWVAELGRELKWRNDVLREVSLAYAERLPPAQLEAVLARRRRRVLHHRRSTIGSAARRLGTALFTAPGRRPSFWVLLGVLSALAAARTMVAVIIANGLQKHLFALIGGSVGHPIHVHHFNYGIALVALVAMLTLLPTARRAIRRLGFVFGFGVGLIVDEFALLWNLDPDYYQPSSRLAAAAVILAIAQVVYFRGLWTTLFRRIYARLRPAP